MFMRAPPGQTLDGAGPSLLAFKRCPVVEPGQCRLGHHGVALFGHVGNEAPRRQTIEVDQVADAVGHHLGELHGEHAALGVANPGDCPIGGAVQHRGCVADVGLKGVQVGMVRVTMTALIPTDHPPSGVGK